MKDKLFKMYIDNIKKEDVINYCKQNSLNVTTKDINFTYSYIKSIKDFSNIDNHINTLKKNVSPSASVVIDKMFNKYKNYM